jgi:PAS domain S-box-containing protein
MTPYLSITIGGVIITAILTGVSWRHRAAVGGIVLGLLMSFLSFWSATAALEILAHDLPAKIFWSKLQYLGIVGTPLLFLLTVFRFTRMKSWLRFRRVACLIPAPALVFLLAVTNDFHRLVWRDVTLDPLSGLAVYHHGPAIAVWVVIGYLYVFAASLLLVKAALYDKRLARVQALAFLLAVPWPWIANGLYFFGFTPPGQDYTASGFAATGLFLLWGIYRRRLFHLIPVVHEAVISSMEDGLIVLDTGHRVIDLNPAAIELLRTVESQAASSAKGEYIGLRGQDVFARWPELAGRFVAPVPSEIEIALGEGMGKRVFQLRLSPILDRRGRTTSWLVILHDITRLKRTEENLRQRDRLLGGIARIANELVAQTELDRALAGVLGTFGEMMDADRVYIYRNSRDPETGRPLMSHIAEWTRPDVSKQVDNPNLQNRSYDDVPDIFEPLSQGRPFSGIVEQMAPPLRSFLEALAIQSIVLVPIFSGREFWGFIGFDNCRTRQAWPEAEISLLQTGASSIGGALERRRIDSALVETHALLTALLDSIPDIVFFKDVQGTYLGCNPEMARLVGRPRDEILGRTDDDLFPKDAADGFKANDRLVLAEGAPRRNEESLVYPDGTRVMVDTFKAPLRDKYGKTIGLLGVSRNITERKRLEIAKDDFVNMVSHELRTPLTSIKEAIALVTEGAAGPINDEQLEFLAAAKRNVDRLARLINDVLNLQKLQSGRIDFRMALGDINEVLRDVHALMLPTARDKGVALVLDLDPAVPETVFDKDKLIQVVTNLANNALKFTDAGNVTLTSAREGDGAIRVTVSDTGIGIPEEEIKNLFKAFSQVSSAARGKSGSTGLGLAISKEIIAAHYGRIWVESRPGRGSKFHFLISQPPQKEV